MGLLLKPQCKIESRSLQKLYLKDLKLKYEGNDEKEAELFIKLYCSVFTPNEKVDF